MHKLISKRNMLSIILVSICLIGIILISYFVTIAITTNNINKKQEEKVNNYTINFYESIENKDIDSANTSLNWFYTNNDEDKLTEDISSFEKTIKESYSNYLLDLTKADFDSSIISNYQVFSPIIDGCDEIAFQTIINQYRTDELDAQSSLLFYSQYSELNLNKSVDIFIDEINEKENNKSNLQSAIDLIAEEKESDAIEYLNKITDIDAEIYQTAQDLIESSLAKIFEYKYTDAQLSFENGNYENAILLIDELLEAQPTNSDVLNLKTEVSDAQANYVEYYGPMYHIFFHSLIAYTELGFDGDWEDNGYNAYMTTTDELKAMLPQLYENGYVLFDINDYWKYEMEDGKQVMSKNTIMLPAGKKPLILSIDDVSYYDYMQGDGFAERLVIDDDGNVANLIYAPDGSTVINRDSDVMPIVDVFVEEHPDFSHKGAKGIIALTGYEGVLGYKTHELDADDYQTVRDEAKAVADALKANGWQFACHSYTHSDAYSNGKFTLDRLTYDTEKWLAEVTPIIGETNLYISPFGYQLDSDDERMYYLNDKGFSVFCGVGGRPYFRVFDNILKMDRQNLDGFMMHYNPSFLKDLFDIESVYDDARPEFED